MSKRNLIGKWSQIKQKGNKQMMTIGKFLQKHEYENFNLPPNEYNDYDIVSGGKLRQLIKNNKVPHSTERLKLNMPLYLFRRIVFTTKIPKKKRDTITQSLLINTRIKCDFKI